ncbi:MAG: acetolactate synthase small subunit [Candidatus Omnitrophota bacterium]
MKHTISVLVENKFGVLARISGLFSARGFNIASLAVGETEDPAVSRMTIVVDAKDERILDQIKKQLHKLIDVLTVLDLSDKEFFDRELVLFKLNFTGNDKQRIEDLLNKLPAKILEEKEDYVIIEICSSRKINQAALDKLKIFGIRELTRAGTVAIIK